MNSTKHENVTSFGVVNVVWGVVKIFFLGYSFVKSKIKLICNFCFYLLNIIYSEVNVNECSTCYIEIICLNMFCRMASSKELCMKWWDIYMVSDVLQSGLGTNCYFTALLQDAEKMHESWCLCINACSVCRKNGWV